LYWDYNNQIATVTDGVLSSLSGPNHSHLPRLPAILRKSGTRAQHPTLPELPGEQPGAETIQGRGRSADGDYSPEQAVEAAAPLLGGDPGFEGRRGGGHPEADHKQNSIDVCALAANSQIAQHDGNQGAGHREAAQHDGAPRR
jgi:hypothetical protein